MSSKIVTLNANESTAIVEDAKIGDIFTTIVDSNKAVTGMYGFAQKLSLIGLGMGINSYRLAGSFNPFVTR